VEKPFWEKTYSDDDVSTFSKNPTADIAEYWNLFPHGGTVLDVGCGEGRNAIFLAEKGFDVDAFDISEAGIAKAKKIAASRGLKINFFCKDIGEFIFEKTYDVILSHGVLHLCEKEIRDRFIQNAKLHTKIGGYNASAVFTNRLPATPDNAPFTKSLFDVGELPLIYSDWEIAHHSEGIFEDTHPGGIHHEHAFERVIARKKATIKMIACDLDGTLLKSDKNISDKTKNVFKQCRQAGIKIVCATGRGGSAERVAPSEMFDGKITMNGATAKIGDEIVYSKLIPHETARPILLACHARGIKIVSETSGMHYPNFDLTELWKGFPYFEIVDFANYEIDAEKIYVPDASPEEEEFIAKLLPDDLYTVITADVSHGREGTLLQIMHKDATKSKAVAELARLWNIHPSEIAAFGDDLNDIDMLTYAGFGVAMQNALDEVKAASDFICKSNDEDGIADWVCVATK
jgi:tellurite methyltransferase